VAAQQLPDQLRDNRDDDAEPDNVEQQRDEDEAEGSLAFVGHGRREGWRTRKGKYS
jgi:hypothetical protein